MHSLSPYQVRLVSTLLTFVAAAPASAQTSGAAIRGTVSDPSGAVVSGAGITINIFELVVTGSVCLHEGPRIGAACREVTMCRSYDSPRRPLVMSVDENSAHGQVSPFILIMRTPRRELREMGSENAIIDGIAAGGRDQRIGSLVRG